jgi:hypothetical protein
MVVPAPVVVPEAELSGVDTWLAPVKDADIAPIKLDELAVTTMLFVPVAGAIR